MRRKGSTNEWNSTQSSPKKKKFDADSLIRSLQQRVEKLESLVAQLSVANGIGPEFLPAVERKKPGPKPLNPGMVLHDRDELVQMLEYYWPEIEPLCCPNPNAKGLETVLASLTRQMQGRYEFPATQMLKHLSKLLDFLSSDRFRRDPRQIANAFAGFPGIGIWRSLKICQASPCNDAIGGRAIRAYIRRKHPELLGRLSADYSLLNFATAIKSYRNKDARLGAFGTQYLYRSWGQCTANYQSLGVNPIEWKLTNGQHD